AFLPVKPDNRPGAGWNAYGSHRRWRFIVDRSRTFPFLEVARSAICLIRGLHDQHLELSVRAEVRPDQLVSRRRNALQARETRDDDVVWSIGDYGQSKTADCPAPVVRGRQDLLDAALEQCGTVTVFSRMERLQFLDL